MRTGATNHLRPGEEIMPLLSRGNPTDTGVLMSSLENQVQKGGLPNQLYGAIDGSNISGFAVESMISAAKDRVQPYIDDLEFHIEEVLDLTFYHFRNMGHLFVDNGEWIIPVHGKDRIASFGGAANRPEMHQIMQMLMQQGGGMPPDLAAWGTMGIEEGQNVPEPDQDDGILTREDVVKIGTRPEVKLRSMHMQNMTAMANVASMLIDKKIWSRSTAMDEFNIKNPQDEWQKILAEDAQTHPKMLELVMFPEALYQSGHWSGFMAYFATVILPALMQGMGGAPMPGPDGGAPMGPQGAQTVQGDSQPMMGQGQQTMTGPGNAGSPM